MTNAELINALQTDIREVEDDPVKTLSLMWRAADALEADEKHINELTTKCNQLQAEVDNYEKRIAELEAQLPKEGEWIEKWRFKTDGTPFHKIGDMECSVCHGEMLGRFYSKYCPHCGAKMKGERNEQ